MSERRLPKDQEDILEETRRFWNSQAATFDTETDHGLRNPETRAAWQALLQDWLPAHPVSILDLGCGTGSLSVIMAELGHRVIGIDISPAMIELARCEWLSVGLDCLLRQLARRAGLPGDARQPGSE